MTTDYYNAIISLIGKLNKEQVHKLLEMIPPDDDFNEFIQTIVEYKKSFL